MHTHLKFNLALVPTPQDMRVINQSHHTMAPQHVRVTNVLPYIIVPKCSSFLPSFSSISPKLISYCCCPTVAALLYNHPFTIDTPTEAGTPIAWYCVYIRAVVRVVFCYSFPLLLFPPFSPPSSAKVWLERDYLPTANLNAPRPIKTTPATPSTPFTTVFPCTAFGCLKAIL